MVGSFEGARGRLDGETSARRYFSVPTRMVLFDIVRRGESAAEITPRSRRYFIRPDPVRIEAFFGFFFSSRRSNVRRPTGVNNCDQHGYIISVDDTYTHYGDVGSTESRKGREPRCSKYRDDNVIADPRSS